jgi:2-polyprenyl-6-methoxyphenol hydroxylase-like FAD-dependent oxidoreductase
VSLVRNETLLAILRLVCATSSAYKGRLSERSDGTIQQLSHNMSNLNILICGASIAGPACAFFLARTGARITIVERSPQLRHEGQNIDLRGEGQTVVERMGLDKIIRQHTTTEKGVRFVDSANNTLVQFDAGEEGSKGNTFTSDIEILRGDLANIFYDATKDHPNIT